MKRTFLLTIILTITGFTLLAQDETPSDTTNPWEKGGLTNITFSQVSLTNWAAGGENSYSLNGLLNLHANYKKDRNKWENTLDLGYGIIKQGERDVRKTDDKIDFSSKYGYKTGTKWYYTAALNFKTQFEKGYKYNDDEGTKQEISTFMAPGYLLLSLGMEYKPKESFYFMVSPLTGKSTFVLDDTLSNAGAFGVSKGDKIRNEFGGFIKMAVTADVWTNVSVQSKLELFSNYADDPQNIDINWELLLSMKVNEFLSATLSTQLLYDDDTKYTDNDGNVGGARVQFKEVFGVGLSYKF